jgi:hypothetical protein
MPIAARHFPVIPLTLAAGWLTACTDFATPSELSHPQIIAIRATPPLVAAGERAELSVLVAGPNGRIEPRAVTWRGRIEVVGETVWYTAPDDVQPGGIFEELAATVELADGTELAAVKSIGVGLPLAADNPSITEVRADGQAMAAGDAIVLDLERTITLDLSVEPAPTDDAIFSWYSTAGEIDLYRRSPTELAALDEPATGALFVVYRDGFGGIDWRELALRIE